MSDIGRCWCPSCKKWVPENLMNRDYDDDKNLIRVCTPCLEGTADQNDYVYDPHFADVQCVYCDSYNTVELKLKWGWFQCNECGEVFRR